MVVSLKYVNESLEVFVKTANSYAPFPHIYGFVGLGGTWESTFLTNTPGDSETDNQEHYTLKISVLFILFFMTTLDCKGKTEANCTDCSKTLAKKGNLN